jgi:hypothetical protein
MIKSEYGLLFRIKKSTLFLKELSCIRAELGLIKRIVLFQRGYHHESNFP